MTHSRALLLFELLQPVPSLGTTQRPDMFPNGQPAKIAWGFLKLLRPGPAAELWQAPGAAVQVPREAQGLVGALTKTAFNNWRVKGRRR